MVSRLELDAALMGVGVIDGPWHALAEAQGSLARTPADADAVLESLAALTLELTGATSVAVLLDGGRLASSAQARPGEPDEPLDGAAGIESLTQLAGTAPVDEPQPWHLGTALVVTVAAHGAGVTLVVGSSGGPLAAQAAAQCRGLAAVAAARLEAAWAIAAVAAQERDARSAAENQFRLALDFAPVGVALVGLDGRAIRVNRPLSALLGQTSTELLEVPAGSLVHPADYARAAQAANELIAGGRESAECDLRLRRLDGSFVWTRASASVLQDADGAPQQVIVHVQDITERRAVQEDLERQANTDPLTGLMNRRGWESALLSVLDIAIEGRRPLAIGLLDLDHFKVYNDTFGHPAGDRLLTDAARVWTARLAEAADRDGQVAALARIGGEEFGLALPGCTAEDARQLIDELCRLTPRGQSTSGGVTVWNPGEEMSDTLARADGALYAAKRKGRRRVIAVLPA